MKKGLFFTILSISISIATIIIIFSLIHSFKKEVQKDIVNYGANILEMSSSYQDKNDKKEYYFTPPEVYAIKRKFKEIKNTGIMTSGIEDREFGGLVVNGEVRVRGIKYPRIFEGWSGPFCGSLWGITPETQKILKMKIGKGRYINNTDVKLKRRVCILGNYIYNQVGREKAIGKKLELREYISEKEFHQYVFTVIGGLQRKVPLGIPYLDMVAHGRSFKENEVNIGVFVPITTLAEEIGGEKNKKDSLGFGFIFFQTPLTQNTDYGIGESIKDLMNKIIAFCKKNYGQDKEFYINSAGRLIDELETQTRQANTFIAIIGIISLLGSIIGTSSIMLLSVSSRISEIGIRRTVGARKRDIFFQFLLEALVISSKGGTIGIILGVLGAYCIGWYASWDVVIPWYSIFCGLGIILVITIISGLYPAMRAAKISPAEAVKYE